MILTVNKPILEQLLIHANPFLDRKDTTQITSHILFDATKEHLTIKANDYEMGLEIALDSVNIKEEGRATANGKKLLEIVKILKDAPIELSTKNDTLLIAQKSSNFKLPMFNAQDFPTFPSLQNLPKIEIDSVELVKSLKKITPAIDSNNPKYELNGALIDIKEDRINLVATDTKRLALVELPNKSEKRLSLIIPKRAIVEIQKLFFDNVEIFYDDYNLIIKSQNTLFYSKLINGKFPDYERIIPTQSKQKFSLSKSALVDALKQVNIISHEVQIKFLTDRIELQNFVQDNIEVKTHIQSDTPFEEPFTIGVNSKYIIDFIANIDEEYFKIHLNEEETPFILKDKNFLTIIMPIVM